MALPALVLAATCGVSAALRLDSDWTAEGVADQDREWPWNRRLRVDEATMQRYENGEKSAAASVLEAETVILTPPVLPSAWSSRLTFLKELGSGGH
ncbi:ALDH3A2, partial [Symbiodinium pilosum]